MFKWRAIRNAMKVKSRFMRKYYPFRTITDRQQFVLHIIRKNVLTFYNTMDFILFA